MRYRKNYGFTLVELLAVIAIIGVLIALLLPAVQSAREAGRRTTCLNKMKQLSLAMHGYHDVVMHFPPAGKTNVESCTGPQGALEGNPNNDAGAPWTVLILPMMEQQTVYDAYDMNGSFAYSPAASAASNIGVQFRTNSAFECPSDLRNGNSNPLINYYACQGGGDAADASCEAASEDCRKLFTNGTLFNNSAISFQHITDGSSKTALIVESRYLWDKKSAEQSGTSASDKWQGWDSSLRVENSLGTQLLTTALYFGINTDPPVGSWCKTLSGGSSNHKNGAHIATADGAVKFFNAGIDLGVYRSLGIRNDGGPVGDANF